MRRVTADDLRAVAALLIVAAAAIGGYLVATAVVFATVVDA